MASRTGIREGLNRSLAKTKASIAAPRRDLRFPATTAAFGPRNNPPPRRVSAFKSGRGMFDFEKANFGQGKSARKARARLAGKRQPAKDDRRRLLLALQIRNAQRGVIDDPNF